MKKIPITSLVLALGLLFSSTESKAMSLIPAKYNCSCITTSANNNPRTSIERIIRGIIHEFGIDFSEITLEASFTDDLGFDDLDKFELIIKVEKEFNIQIPDEEAEKLTTVGSLVDFVRNKIS